ncbi:MAG: hypothetical protein ABJG47_01285 [Ekhidna sp.]
MNKIFLYLFLILAASFTNAQKTNISLEGEYMGQETPDLTAKLFAPDFISTDNSEKAASFHPNGKEFYFTREGEEGLTKIMFSKIIDTKWSLPEALPIPNQESFRAFVTKDGSRMFFASIDLVDEQDSRREYNIWVMDREDSTWKNPRPLDSHINTPDALELHPSVADDGTLYFKRFSFQDETEKIFYSEWKDGQYLQAKPFEADLGSFAEDPFISPDESYVIFNPSGPTKFGSMHISFRDDKGNWTTPKDMGLNGELPSLSPDRKYLFFIRNNDVYWVDAKIIENFR